MTRPAPIVDSRPDAYQNLQTGGKGTRPKESDAINETFKDDDWFDIDKYKQAAQVAYDFSIGKMREAGEQERETDRQQQAFREKDEERDYKQSQKGYRF